MISLKKLCYNKIIQEFERFNFAFGISDDEDLKGNFIDLRRDHSFALCSELSQNGEIKEEYFNFLLNEHLEILEMNWLKICDEDCIEGIIRRVPNLKKISLGRKYCDKFLENIAIFCSKIIVINVPDLSDISDVGIKYLSQQNVDGKVPCPDLRTLSINSRGITVDGLSHLIQNLPFLKKIDHKDVPRALYSIHKDCLTNLESLPNYNLIYLDFYSCCKLPYYTDILKVCLNACPEVKTVFCRIFDEKQLELFSKTSLETLRLSVSGLDQKIDNFLINSGCNLVSLNINHCIVSINVLAESCPNLKYLETCGCDFSYDKDGDIIFHCLTNCFFKQKIVDKKYIEPINSILLSSPGLDRLSFESLDLSRFTDIGLLTFCKNNLLKHIHFYNCVVDIRIVKDILLRCSHLECLQWGMYDDEVDKREELREFVETLSYKPNISVDGSYINNNNNYKCEEYLKNSIIYNKDFAFEFI